MCVCPAVLHLCEDSEALFWRCVKAGYHHGSRGYVYKEVSVSSKNIQQNQIRAGARVCVCVFVNTKLDFTSLRFPWYNISKLLFMCVSVSSSFSSDRHSLLHTCHRTHQNITTQSQTLIRVWTHSGHTRTHVSTQFQIWTHSQTGIKIKSLWYLNCFPRRTKPKVNQDLWLSFLMFYKGFKRAIFSSDLPLLKDLYMNSNISHPILPRPNYLNSYPHSFS